MFYRTLAGIALALSLSSPVVLGQSQQPQLGYFEAVDTAILGKVDEGPMRCGQGAMARALDRIIIANDLIRPAGWDDAQSIYERLVEKDIGWSKGWGMRPTGLESAVAAMSETLATANGGLVSVKVRTIDGQNKASRLLETGELDLTAAYLEVRDALDDPTRAVIIHTNCWMSNGMARTGHIWNVTSISGEIVSRDGVNVAQGVTFQGVDDGISNNGEGADPTSAGPFDSAGVGEDWGDGNQEVIVAIQIIRLIDCRPGRKDAPKK